MKQLMNPNDYKEYVQKQWKDIDRTYELKLFSKHIDIIDKFLQIYETPKEIDQLKVLCIGARYGIEIMAFQELGFQEENITAIDIYPRNKKIIKADMHDLPFDDSVFDIIYSHHSLDHSLFPKKTLAEMSRVSKQSTHWILSIPFSDYGKEEAIDFDSEEEIITYISNYKKNIKFSLSVSRNKDGFVEPNHTWLPEGWYNELRIIVQ